MSGRVVLITGGAGGLGRSYAEQLAARGAALVVNDTGGDLDGTSPTPGPAEAVVAEIRAAGGEACASLDDVSTPDGAAAAVQRAVDEYGRLDVVVNNAGILRDRTFAKMTAADFEDVLRVHLSGTAHCTRAAWPALRESGTGRVVLTTSASGLYGQFGQANYAAAKAGLLGLLNVLKQEGARHGIRVNAIAPVARTRMTEPLLPEDAARGLDPGLVAPVVVYLCSEECDQTGLILEVGAGMVARVQVVESAAVQLPRDEHPDEAVHQLVAQLANAEPGQPYPTSQDALSRVIETAAASAR